MLYVLERDTEGVIQVNKIALIIHQIQMINAVGEERPGLAITLIIVVVLIMTLDGVE